MAGQTTETVEVIQARINRIYQMLIMGLKPQQIWQNMANDKERPYKKSYRTLYRDVNRARKQLEEAAKPERAFALGKAKERLELLFLKAMSIQDYKTALSVVREINELLGLREPIRAELTGKDGGPISVQDAHAELIRRIAGLAAARGLGKCGPGNGSRKRGGSPL